MIQNRIGAALRGAAERHAREACPGVVVCATFPMLAMCFYFGSCIVRIHSRPVVLYKECPEQQRYTLYDSHVLGFSMCSDFESQPNADVCLDAKLLDKLCTHSTTTTTQSSPFLFSQTSPFLFSQTLCTHSITTTDAIISKMGHGSQSGWML